MNAPRRRTKPILPDVAAAPVTRTARSREEDLADALRGWADAEDFHYGVDLAELSAEELKKAIERSPFVVLRCCMCRRPLLGVAGSRTVCQTCLRQSPQARF